MAACMVASGGAEHCPEEEGEARVPGTSLPKPAPPSPVPSTPVTRLAGGR